MAEDGRDRKTFRPEDYLRTLQGGSYLDVKWRIMWLRMEHPDAAIDTELVKHWRHPLTIKERKGKDWVERTIEVDEAVFKALVRIPDQIDDDGVVVARGGSATGYGSEHSHDFRDYLEKAECCEDATEILTREGFKRHEGLTVGEEVLAYDPQVDRCVWTPLRRVVTYEDTPVVRLAGKWFEAVVTPNHSWATAGTYRSWVTGQAPRRLRRTTELRSSDRIILAALAPDGESDITPDEAAILGWLFTDGTVWKGDGSLQPVIMQSKLPMVEKIRALVGAGAREWTGLPTVRTFPSGRTYECLPQHTFAFPVARIRSLLERAAVHTPMDLPGLIPRLTHPARAAMLEAMMDADGDGRGYFGKQRKTGVFEAWRILCTLEGLAVGPLRNAERFPVQRAKDRRYVSCSELKVEDAGRMRVWCPTTDYGTWVARLPTGQVTITGNTKALGRALGALGFGTQFATDFADPATAKRGRRAMDPEQFREFMAGLAKLEAEGGTVDQVQAAINGVRDALAAEQNKAVAAFYRAYEGRVAEKIARAVTTS